MRPYILNIALLTLAHAAVGQGGEPAKPATEIPLKDMSAFRQQAGNWQVVGDVTMNPTIDIHEKPAPVQEPSGKKKKATPVIAKPQPVTFTAGTGILLNMNDETRKDHLISNFEHGDIELELDVMIPKGSNSGIYLQGRYEVQLLDSWGVRYPKFSDIGGIYRNWENTPGKIYMGKAPIRNAAKAPGLWQHLKIEFRAPRFDASGNKVANARFTSVELNGVKIHDNVEVPLPTGGPLENNEKAMGPLMIQGDHGPVAFRNIRYTLKRESKITLTDISYKTYYGKFASETEFGSLKPAAEGKLQELTNEILDKEDQYAATYVGMLTLPEDGDYQFLMRFSGGGSIRVNGQELVSFQRGDGWIDQRKTLSLKAGTYPLEIRNFKDVGWMPPLLGVWVQTAEVYPVALHGYNSFPPFENPTSPILINASAEPRLLRAFIDYKGDRSQRLTHTIGVADPAGINYVYDLKAGNLVCVWRGDFVDATPMWHDRGDGSFKPVGAVQYLSNIPPLATLDAPDQAFAKSASEKEFKGKGYVIEESSARPVFKYQYKGIEVEDKLYPDDENRVLTREVVFKNAGDKSMYRIAGGNAIREIAAGLYAIDGQQFYIRIDPSFQPAIRDVDGGKEIVVPAKANLKYSILW